MSHGHEHGGCLSYVVSRSGKILDASGRVLEELVPTNVQPITHARPLASFEGEPNSFFDLAAVLLTRKESLPSSKKRKLHQFTSKKPTENKRTRVWEDEIGSLDDIARAILRRHNRRKCSRKKQHSELRGSENTTGGGLERHRRLVQHLKIGISQMFTLQKWESGSRELPAKWASWLLKMLRKAKPPSEALQRFLFTVLGAILPVICCSLVCQTLSILPDSEVLRSVDILCTALEKSWWCFSPFQWEILEERIYQCQQVRPKAGTWLERKGKTPNNLPIGDGFQHKKAKYQSVSSSSDEYAVSNDVQMSNELVLSEGVTAMVRRALRERQISPSFKRGQVDSSQDVGIPVSTICPLSGMRLKIPARGISCAHWTCFDLERYLEVNAELAETMQKPKWRCPYCGSDASWPQIIVDGFILRILKSLPENIPEVVIYPDGRWKAIEHSVEPELDSSVYIKKPSGQDAVKDTPVPHPRNVKPRLDTAPAVSQTDDSAWEAPQNAAAEEGDLSGNEASCVKPRHCEGVDIAGQTSNDLDGQTVHLNGQTSVKRETVDSDIRKRHVPVLHEINLRSLIQSNLDRCKSNHRINIGTM